MINEMNDQELWPPKK